MSTPSRQDFTILIIRSASTGLSRLFTKIPKRYRVAMLPRQLLLRPTVLRPQTLLSVTKPARILPFAARTLTKSPYSKTLRRNPCCGCRRAPCFSQRMDLEFWHGGRQHKRRQGSYLSLPCRGGGIHRLVARHGKRQLPVHKDQASDRRHHPCPKDYYFQSDDYYQSDGGRQAHL